MRTATLEELLEEFADFEIWEERYGYIIDLGRELDDLPADKRTEEHRVQGCISNVWLVLETEPGNPPLIRFAADSDSQLVRGLVAILVSLCSGRSAAEILALDLESLFEKLDLRRHLSRSRSNGLHSMIKRIRTLAELHQ